MVTNKFTRNKVIKKFSPKKVKLQKVAKQRTKKLPKRGYKNTKELPKRITKLLQNSCQKVAQEK